MLISNYTKHRLLPEKDFKGFKYPDQYIPNESFGDALWFSGEQDQGMAVFETWLESHPDHTMARRRLATMKSQR